MFTSSGFILNVLHSNSRGLIRRDGQMSRTSISHFGRWRDPHLGGSNPGGVQPITLKLILVVHSLVLGIIRIGQGLVGSVSG